MKRPRRKWLNAPVVHVTPTVVACPHCGCEQFDRSRSDPNGDGTNTRKCICVGCDDIFKIVIELPQTGNSEVWDQ
jgi:hypothetical protein